MTDPATSYEKRDELRAIDHDRIGTIYKLAFALLPMTIGAIFAAGMAWLRIADHEVRIATLTAEMRVVERLSLRSDEKLVAQGQTLNRIERLLEDLRNAIPPNHPPLP